MREDFIICAFEIGLIPNVNKPTTETQQSSSNQLLQQQRHNKSGTRPQETSEIDLGQGYYTLEIGDDGKDCGYTLVRLPMHQIPSDSPPFSSLLPIILNSDSLKELIAHLTGKMDGIKLISYRFDQKLNNMQHNHKHNHQLLIIFNTNTQGQIHPQLKTSTSRKLFIKACLHFTTAPLITPAISGLSTHRRFDPKELDMIHNLSAVSAPLKGILSTLKKSREEFDAPETGSILEDVYNAKSHLTTLEHLYYELIRSNNRYYSKKDRKNTITHQFFAHPERIRHAQIYHHVVLLD
ncbi:hypothetical protein BY996DRAFT_6593746 [Phakopsora pachyrhizi]|uniref:Uncharacterized protein n=1 Tax=Phakopsora pachyrhizi TaxID=170000 RepID=A0AAV0APQ5_PHAPC|nr:hypothetical protein BY996DRAFT_6593746 [Phakopsora pachyrhizi]CAH7670853.1 hypothetical protein PPACK8108_LOCUS5595 [Phakopsora pachyrhizi]